MHYVVRFLFENFEQLKHNLWPEDERTTQHIWCETVKTGVCLNTNYLFTLKTQMFCLPSNSFCYLLSEGRRPFVLCTSEYGLVSKFGQMVEIVGYDGET